MIQISVAHNEARLEATRAYLDQGASPARIRIYGGTRAANINTAPGSPMLVEIALDDPCGVVSSNALVLTSSDLPVVLNGGNATWARIVNGNGDAAIDADVSTTGGAGEVQLPATLLVEGGTTTLVSAVLG